MPLSPAPCASSGPVSGLGGLPLEPVPGQVTAPAAELDRLRIKELQGPAGHRELPLIPAPGAGAEPRRRVLGCQKPGRSKPAASCPTGPLRAWHRPWETTGEGGQVGAGGAEGHLHHTLRSLNQGCLHESPQNPPVSGNSTPSFRARLPFCTASDTFDDEHKAHLLLQEVLPDAPSSVPLPQRDGYRVCVLLVQTPPVPPQPQGQCPGPSTAPGNDHSSFHVSSPEAG